MAAAQDGWSNSCQVINIPDIPTEVALWCSEYTAALDDSSFYLPASDSTLFQMRVLSICQEANPYCLNIEVDQPR